MRKGLCLLWLFAFGCGPSSRDDSVAHIEVTPADLAVTILNGAPITQAYTATFVGTDGSRRDVTQTVVFGLKESAYGTFVAQTLTVSGGAAGPTRVIATDPSGVMGDTGLTVNVKGTRFDGTGVPPNADDLFATATETAGHAPTIAYPADGILVPPNLGEFDVHWTDSANNNLFQITLQNTYIDLTIYKAASGSTYTTYTPSEWFSLASPREELTLTVAGLSTGNPTMKGTAVPQHVDVTNEIVQGGVYYWTTEPSQGVYRYDMGTPNVPPSSFFDAGKQPTGCIGCHALSKDGTKMALTLDSGDGRGTVYDVATKTAMVPYDSNPQYWNFATFNADATKLVTVYHGQMVLRNAMGGAQLATIPSSGSNVATHPELSPDGTRLANVETTHSVYDFEVEDGAIVTRSFDNTTNAFGPIQTLVANQSGLSSYYPSWSPDGQWILFTRTAGNSYSDASAEIWIVKSDGTQPPIQLQLADKGTSLTNSWARWAPFQQSFGPNNTPVYFFTFSTLRPFGVRTTGGTQIWMAPFIPDRAMTGQDPSGAAFHLPFQVLETSNHIAQWTEAVIIGRKADGTPLTQAEAYATP